jgi:glycosyltransferase involved in cell wall biosynthesis
MSGTPMVTAVLVCWNHAPYVRAAVESALGQTHRPLQLIVFDNGSTDGSAAILQQLAREHGFELHLLPSNAGLVPVLNRGLALAAGEYFATLATDDIWLADKTARQVAFFEAHPDVQMVSGQVRTIDEHGRPVDFPATRRPGEVSFADLMRRGCNVAGPTVMCRTATLRAFGGYDESARIEDYAMALRFTHAGHRVVSRDEVDTLYRRHSSNWTGRPLWPELRELGRPYRGDPEYRAFARHSYHGWFRALAAEQKAQALRLLRDEPLRWSWNDIGVGLLKLLVPAAAARRWRRFRSPSTLRAASRPATKSWP